MPGPSRLPRMSRVDFYRLTGGEFLSALARAVAAHAEQHPGVPLTAAHAAVVAWARLEGDVPNGGFTQFFYNHRGDYGVAEVANLLDATEVPKAAAALREAAAVYRRHRAAFATPNPWDGLFGGIPEFDKPEREFVRGITRGTRVIETWVRSHVAELAVGDADEPIDVRFTGAVEIPQPNGLVGEYLEVKKGKPGGAYRTFFEDGTVRRVVFYKAGKVSGDFWPDGRLKRKESRRGPLTVIEWFYPGGAVRKRYVKDKSGYAVEPVRVFHENGQLAEELTTAGGRKCGPWLKFFPDGAPQLRAEYTADEELVVHDAWDADRNPVVADGTGTFRDDGRDIDWPYDLFFESSWRSERELKGGIPHGRTTTFHDGVLWGVSSYANGVRDEESTTYWDNGRVRTVTRFTHGTAGESRSFPKFDHPVPAVVLCVEANESLYTAWDHMPVDEYPRVLNLDEVRQRLRVPDFLRGVDERNRAGSLQSEYENCNTFNDGIAYFLAVDESGVVAEAFANGSGPYSGGVWDAYPPLLRDLRFTPGRVRGRAVACRVLARVDHTFVERPTT